ncbi:MAG TPA: hypothetical protein VJ397_00385 [Thermoplasmata archaeon]|nr:hypothetical protein [Thermoplasmata archaeon]
MDMIELRLFDDLVESLEVEGVESGSVTQKYRGLDTLMTIRERLCGGRERT